MGEMVMKKAYCKRCHTKMGQYIISYPRARDEHPEFGVVLPETYSISTRKLLVWDDGRFFQVYYSEIPYDGDAGDEIGDSDSEDGSHIPPGPGGINSEDDVAGEETGEGDANGEGDIEKGDDIGKGDAAGKEVDAGETDVAGKGVDAGETMVAWKGVDVAGGGVDAGETNFAGEAPVASGDEYLAVVPR